jgi:hypothetical protein
MTAASNIVISDGQSTPVAHTFVPARKAGDVVFWEERVTANTAAGFYTISIGANSPTSRQVVRAKIALAIPFEVLDSDTGLYSYPSIGRANIDILVPVSATVGERANLYAYIKNLVSNSVIDNLVNDLDTPF